MNVSRRLFALMSFCLIGCVTTLCLWLVNLEMAIRVYRPLWQPLERILPEGFFAVAQWLSSDLSTVSTVVPLMLFAFPLVQTYRVRRALPSNPHLAASLESAPYPPQFSFFLVMLGLVGTLYGLMIGLDLSGVSALSDASLSQDAIRSSLNRLLGGTATALLSSLVGLLGAFVAARPMAWLFRCAAGVPTAVAPDGLSEAITHLTQDLNALGSSSRSLASWLSPEAASTFLETLQQQQASLAALVSESARVTGLLERLVEHTERGWQGLAETMQGIKTDTSSLSTIAEKGQERLVSLETGVHQAGSSLSALQAEVVEQGNRLSALQADAAVRHDALIKILEGMSGEMLKGRETIEQDRESRRKALEAYVAASSNGP